MVPSLKEKSVKSSSFLAAPPLTLTTPFSSTFCFLPVSATESLAISGSDSVLLALATDLYKYYLKINGNYLDGLVTEVLNDGFHFIISVEVDGISVGDDFFLEVGLE